LHAHGALNGQCRALAKDHGIRNRYNLAEIVGTVISPTSSDDAGNNVAWFSGITISGSSDLGSGTVALAYDTVLQSGDTGTISGNAWSITPGSTPGTGAVITVWIDGAADADESTAVTKYDGGGNITGLVLDQHVLSIGSSNDATTLTITNLGQWDNSDDPNVMHTVLSESLTVDADFVYLNETLQIINGGTLSVGATETVYTGTMTIAGTLITSGTINVAGSWINTGTFSAGANSKVLFTGTVGSPTITSGGDAFNDVYINDGLVAYWKFDDGFGSGTNTNALDSSGYGNTGVLTMMDADNTDWVPSGTFTNFANPYRLDFDGSNDYVNTNFAPIFSPTDDFSIGLWFKSDLTTFTSDGEFIGSLQAPNYTILIEIDGDGSRCADDEIIFGVLDGDSTFDLVCSIDKVDDTDWHYVTATYDVDGDMKIYIDGVLNDTVAVVNSTGTKDLSSRPLAIGAFNFNGTILDYFDGSIDDVRIYNRVLTQGEITALANGNQPGTGVTTFTLQDAMDIDGTLFLNSGTFDVGSDNAITIGKDWENNGGDFLAQTGTVTFDGTTQSIPSSETFYNFSKTVTLADTMTFGQSSTLTIQGTMRMQGASGQLLFLRSSTDGTQWNIDPQDTTNRFNSFLNVQ